MCGIAVRPRGGRSRALPNRPHPAFLWLAALLVSVRLPQQSPAAPILTTAQQVRALPPEQAKLGHPVRVRGQVLVLSGWKNSFFFSDGTAGISIDRNDALPELHSGDRVEVVGKSAAGFFAPIIVSDRVQTLGKASLPPAPRLDYLELIRGAQDSQWVQVRGVVHAAWIAPSWGRDVLFMEIDMGGARITARVREFSIQNPSTLVDAEVSLRGVCGTNFNGRRQLVGLRLFVAAMSDVAIQKPAPADPFALPLEPLDGILHFSANESRMEHRVRVQGIVTERQPGSLYIQDGGKGLYLETAQPSPVALGARIEAVGFGSPGTYSPQLEGVIFRVVGSGPPTPPLPLRASQMIGKDQNGFPAAPYDALLVRIRGLLVERVAGQNASGGAEEVLTLREDNQRFHAYLPRRESDTLPDLKIGSELELTGVASIQADSSREPSSFEIHLRSPADIAIVHPAPWWDLRHSLDVLAFATLALFALLIYAALMNWASKALKESLAVSESARKELADQKFALDQHALVVVTDVQGAITYVNDRFCGVTQYSRDELLGRNLRILNSGHHPREFFQQMYATISAGKVWQGEIKNRAKDGTFYWIDTTIVPFLDSNGKPRQYVAIRTDISERKRAQQALADKAEELARSNRELEQFAYVASHDLQEPLRMVASYTQLLAERYQGKLDETADKFIAYASEGALRMQVMIQDLLAFSRVGRTGGTREPVDCNAVVDDLMRTLAAAIEESGAVITRAGLPVVLADRTLIAQLFQNLIGNAIKFRRQAPPEIVLRAEKAGQNWLFSVSDNGIGIPPESAESVFVVFQRLHARSEFPGNGIGLAICKKIVEHFGGTIWVEAHPGPGTTFRFTLPQLPVADSPAAQTQPTLEPALTGK